MILTYYLWLRIWGYFSHLVCQILFSCFCQLWSWHSGISDQLWVNLNCRYPHGILCQWKFSRNVWQSWAFKFWAVLFWLYLLVVRSYGVIDFRWHCSKCPLTELLYSLLTICISLQTKSFCEFAYLFYLGNSQKTFCLSTFLVAF